MNVEDLIEVACLAIVGLSAAVLLILKVAPERWLRFLDSDPREVTR